MSSAPPSPPEIDIGRVEEGKISFPEWGSPTDKPTGAPKNPDPPESRVGFAVLGLGRLSLEEILPAFAQAKHARLAALISGTPDKLRRVGEQYGVPPDRCYSYHEVDRLKADRGVQVVYVVTPNALHEAHVGLAAAAGKHVLCEKPMTVSADAAQRMIAECERAGRLLMIAYRSQFQPHMREAIRIARSGQLGRIKLVNALNIENLGDASQWRLRRELAGGGSLPDIGLYCLNSVRAIVGEEPEEVYAAISSPADDPRFATVEDQVSFILRFPSGVLATCATGYDGHKQAALAVNCQTGWIAMESAFEYRGQRLRVARRRGDQEEISELFPKEENQFALEIDHMAQCVRENRQPMTPGLEGLKDQRLMQAIYRSAAERRPIPVE
jgi:predicted dehydrogenase